MPPKARIAVIGTGWWATYAHIPTLKAHPDAQLVALADVRSEVLSKASEKYDIGTVYTDFQEMLANESLDGAVIAVWHAAHYEVARACLERGLHVVLEKPMVLQAVQARDLCGLAREHRCEIIMGYPWHFLTQTVRAREVVQSGALGQIHYVSSLFSSSAYDLYRGEDHSDNPEMAAQYPVVGPGDVYRDPARSGGGQGYLQVTHSAALMFFVSGLKPVSVIAQMDNLDVPVDVVDAIIVRMDNGALASVSSTGAVRGGNGKLDIQIYCKNGWVDLDYIDCTGTIYHADGSQEKLTPNPDAGDVNYRDLEGYIYPAHAPVHNLVEVILGQSPNRSPAETGRRTVELLDAAYRSAAMGGQAINVASLYD